MYMCVYIYTYIGEGNGIHTYTYVCACMRQWHPTPVLLPGKSHGLRSLVGCSPWGFEESDMTERLHFHFSNSRIEEGNGNPLWCSCLENPRDGGAWWAAVYGVAQSQTQLKRLSSSSIHIYIHTNTHIYILEKKMAKRTEEPGGLQSVGSQSRTRLRDYNIYKITYITTTYITTIIYKIAGQERPTVQHRRKLLLSPVTSTAGCCVCFGSIPSFFLELFLH